MSHNPTTFAGEPPHDNGQVDWTDYATLHRRGDGGVLSGFKSIRHGTLAELVRFVAHLPEDERRDYAIEKAGDHRYEWHEIMALYQRADFPHAGG